MADLKLVYTEKKEKKTTTTKQTHNNQAFGKKNTR